MTDLELEIVKWLCLMAIISTAAADCWETSSCQLDSWQVKGCAQYGRVESSRRPCNGGNYYTCCTSSSGGSAPAPDCWETSSCQLDSWQVKGCAQYGRVESSRRPCNGGYYYTCCAGTPSSPGSQTGKTTRYWDCCKPSCSWNNKAPVISPVKTCQRDGISPVGSNEASGCSNGPAFTCNDNQPFVGDNNVAYGFAAAHLTGQTEYGWCCACFELTFTSGSVSGQKMIVQVTNTGGDLGENHFDLQIPGGGVGIFNGCKPQWGAPDQGWGDRYGGVHSESECNQLPDKIRAGCKWRFGWFKNANNPTMTFKPVTCPAVLTSKSGCTRTRGAARSGPALAIFVEKRPSQNKISCISNA